MLKQILSPNLCAKCKGCCFFDKGDAWEIPESVKPRLTAENLNNSPDNSNGEALIKCARLKENGCDLKDEKPIECQLYPFRVMKLGEAKVFAVAAYCPEIRKLSLFELLEFTEKTYKKALSLAESEPNSIKEYRDGYAILKVIT